ncbi:uncharacterized protein PgNI_11782 [Pyricularia grisea]|uniref:Uncharacterized protein n=1 Tax=Pyricularia grisea TaxID=148305 RepID=A0A6P8AP23_PYRGI|nr:uncharacterized protein PgNI_11782 [Pyricularia grisea]TLD03771.1 hypothetical protein PgNI_11782 [Pyricularia grisea]
MTPLLTRLKLSWTRVIERPCHIHRPTRSDSSASTSPRARAPIHSCPKRLEEMSSGDDSPSAASFCTASEVPDREHNADTTAQTSPSQCDDAPAKRKGHAGADHGVAHAPPVMSVNDGYREAKLLPRELRDQCKIYLEERMYIPAMQMLCSTLSAGGHRTNPNPAFIPPHPHLAFLASLAIHPKFTNRPTTSDGQSIGSRAMQYLQALQRTVGPVNANLAAAFDFEPWRKRARRGAAASAELDLSEDEDLLRGQFVEGYVVFAKAESFWKLVGWAFNCSALHAERWRYWRVWLEFLVDVLERDYQERERLDDEAGGDDCGETSDSEDIRGTRWREGSLLFRYVCSTDRRSSELNRSTIKGMLRAIFADGTESSVREFPELFTDEAKPKPTAGAKRKRGLSTTLDLEREQYGDYLDEDGYSSSGSQPVSPSGRQAKRMRGGKAKSAGPVEDPPPSECLLESVGLRLRLFELLGIAIRDHSGRADGLEDLYSDFCFTLRSLHLDTFSAFIAPYGTGLPLDSLVTVIRETMEHFQPKTAPKPSKVDKAAAEGGFVTMALMEKCYLPTVASGGVDNNARYSLLVEALLRIMWQAGQVSYTPELDEAIRAGVAARNDCKGGRGGRAKESTKDDAARRILAESGDRLELLLDIIHDEEERMDCDGDQQGTLH